MQKLTYKAQLSQNRLLTGAATIVYTVILTQYVYERAWL
jgi:hypothetical protein